MYCWPLGCQNESASSAYQKGNIWHASRPWTGRTPTPHNFFSSIFRSRHDFVGYHSALLLSSLSLAPLSYQLYLEILTLPEDSPLSTLPALLAASTALGEPSCKHTPTNFDRELVLPQGSKGVLVPAQTRLCLVWGGWYQGAHNLQSFCRLNDHQLIVRVCTMYIQVQPSI